MSRLKRRRKREHNVKSGEHNVKSERNHGQDRTTRVDAKQLSRDGQSICIMGFVDGDVIPPWCYDEPYCLQPNKDDTKAYDVLREVMHRTRKVGLAAVIIERKQTLAAVIPIGRTLVLNVLRLATGLIPGTKSAANRLPLVAAAPPAKLTRPVHVAATLAPPRRAAAPASSVIKPSARPISADDEGAVIDLAVRRSSKRAAQTRPVKAARTRTAAIATLHELRRKPATRTSPAQRQLA